MRIEYIVVSFVLIAIVLAVALGMLKGIVPGVQSVFGMFGG